MPSDLNQPNSQRKTETLKGRFDGSNQGEFPGEVALRIMRRTNLFQGRLHLGTNLFGIHTARVEVTTCGRVGSVGNLASKQDAFLPWVRIGEWNGGHERLGVRVFGVRENLRRRG